MYKLFKAIKHQIEKGPVDVRVKKAKYTLNDTGLLGDDVEYSVLVRSTCAHSLILTHTHAQTHTEHPSQTVIEIQKLSVIKTAHSASRLHGVLCLVSNTNTHTYTLCSCRGNPPPKKKKKKP